MRKTILICVLLMVGALILCGTFFYYWRIWNSKMSNKISKNLSSNKSILSEKELSHLDYEEIFKNVLKNSSKELLIKSMERQKGRLKASNRLWGPSLLAIRYKRNDLLAELLDKGFLGNGGEILWQEVVDSCDLDCGGVLAEKKIKPNVEIIPSLIQYCPKKEMLSLMLKAGLDLNQKDSRGLYPIHYLITSGLFDLANAAIKSGASLNLKEKGVSLLCSVISDKNVTIAGVDFLLQKGARWDLCSGDLCPLHCAIDVGRVDIIGFLLDKGVSLYSPPPKGRSRFYAFELAAVYGGVKTLDFLLSRLSPKERQSLIADLGFWQALCYPSNFDVSDDLSLLVKKYRINPNSTVRAKWGREIMDVPIVSIIAFNGNIEALKTILDLGGYARVGGENVRPIKFAALGKNVQTVDVLLDRGANPFYLDKDKVWNLYHLILNSQDTRDDVLVKVIKRLSSYKIDPNKHSRAGRTPIMVALLSGRSLEVIRALIEVGADVNAVDYTGWSVLLYGLRFAKDPRIITLLLVKGANVPESTPDGRAVSSLLHQNPYFTKHWYRHLHSWENWGLVAREANGEHRR